MSLDPKTNIFSSPFPGVMTESQAAAYLGKGVKTLQRRRRARQIAYIRDGGIRYLRSDLDAYLAARRVEATEPPPPSRPTRYRSTKAPAYDVVDLLYD